LAFSSSSYTKLFGRNHLLGLTIAKSSEKEVKEEKTP